MIVVNLFDIFRIPDRILDNHIFRLLGVFLGVFFGVFLYLFLDILSSPLTSLLRVFLPLIVEGILRFQFLL